VVPEHVRNSEAAGSYRSSHAEGELSREMFGPRQGANLVEATRLVAQPTCLKGKAKCPDTGLGPSEGPEDLLLPEGIKIVAVVEGQFRVTSVMLRTRWAQA
jgi:hypothetical protein